MSFTIASACACGISAGCSVFVRDPTTSICIDCQLSVMASSSVKPQFLVENQPAGCVSGVGLRTVQDASII